MTSVRSRLTLVIALLAAVGSLAAVYWGTQLIERQLVNDALDESIANFAFDETKLYFPGDPENLFPFGPDFSLSEVPDVIDAETFELMTGQDVSGEPFFEPLATELLIAEFDIAEEVLNDTIVRSELYLRKLEGTPVLDELFDAYDTDNDGVFHAIWTPEASYAVTRTSVRLDESVPASGVDTLATIDSLAFLDFLYFGVAGVTDGAGDDLVLAFDSRPIGEYELTYFADTTAILDNVAQVRTSLWIAAALTTILAAVSTWFLTGRALAPVAAMTRQVGDISAGNLEERIPVHNSRDEIGGLAVTMNTMLGRIDAGNRQRQQFVSDAAHELRTPVAVLRSEAEVALKAPSFTDVDQLASVVLAESDRLGVLVEDLLTLARVDEGRPKGATQTVDVDEVVFAEAGRSRTIPVDCRQVSAGRIVGRADDLARLASHLLNNAVRHARSSVAVGVQTDEATNTVVLWVDDDGMGVPAAERERIFERFVRLDEARTRDSGGAGLGLAVVQATTADLGGTVRVEDSPLGGARFVVSIPAA